MGWELMSLIDPIQDDAAGIVFASRAQYPSRHVENKNRMFTTFLNYARETEIEAVPNGLFAVSSDDINQLTLNQDANGFLIELLVEAR